MISFLPGVEVYSPSSVMIMNFYRTSSLKNLFVVLPAVLLLAACGQEKEPGPDTNPASMECKVENNNWRATSFSNRLVRSSTSAYMGKRLDISGVALNGSTITLTISDPSSGIQGDGIKPDTYHTNVYLNLPPDYQSGTPVKGAVGTYMQLTDQKLYISDLSEGDGQIIITACDAVRKTVSGTFSFTADSMTDTGKVTIAAGTFTNLSYNVAN
jgi:hypothetical protein